MASGAPIELWPRERPRDETAGAQAVVVFNSRFTLAAADREVVLFDLGRCATAGDAAVWLPAERALITGRIASRGRVEATLNTDLVSWIAALERLRGLDPAIVVPGRGNPGGDEILRHQVERLKELRDVVEDGLLSGRSAAEIIEGTTGQ